ncbi:phosphatase PAP2 family protein [Mucilaginibacter xinganensis]|uniref:Phosphatase PAP2 family protein n=1 Tax=Mucilaginibacter xinganensis TaxID=1234841 RepID=A0A223NWU1_9SPHI|nr:phosphatase PAP2 family protein [Mucilaginibacter xinganensis]ASU34068.1 phosphatase PAP2 family protein [Mucilaginibacter xinganensis]
MQLTERKKKIMVYVIGGIIVGFLLLTAFVIIFQTTFIDKEFSEEIQEHQNPFLDTAMKFVSWFGYMPNAALTVLGTCCIFLFYGYKKEAIYLAMSMLSGLVSTIFKFVINRPRPAEPLVRIVAKASQQSFPSGHMLFYVVFFGFLTLLMFQLKNIAVFVRVTVAVISLLLIFVVPFSRIYLGAHWFTDVLGGFLLGLLCLYLLSFYYLKSPNSKYF